MASRRSTGILLAVIGVGGLIVASVFVAPVCMLGFALSCRDDPELDAALDRYFQGHELFDEGRYAEAAEHYRAWKDYEDAHDEDSSEVTGLIGHALDLAGRTQEAKELIDASLAIEKRWYVCLYKAHFLARHESDESALAWLNEAQLPDASRARAIASFYRERGRYADAIPVLKDLLEQVEGRRFLVDGAIRVPPVIDTATHNQISSLLDPLQDLAENHLQVRDFDAADKYAQLGITVGQILNRDATYAGDKYVEAGDVRCRIVRARVLMQRGEWDASGEEIGFAKAIADWSGYSGSVEAVQSATQELQHRRSKR